MNTKKYLKKKNQLKYKKILGLINDKEEYQKIHNHDWRKHKSTLHQEKNRWN